MIVGGQEAPQEEGMRFSRHPSGRPRPVDTSRLCPLHMENTQTTLLHL